MKGNGVYIQPFGVFLIGMFMIIGAFFYMILEFIVGHLFNYSNNLFNMLVSIFFILALAFYAANITKIYDGKINIFKLFKNDPIYIIPFETTLRILYIDSSVYGDINIIIFYSENNIDKKMNITIPSNRKGKEVIKYFQDNGLEDKIEMHSTYYD